MRSRPPQRSTLLIRHGQTVHASTVHATDAILIIARCTLFNLLRRVLLRSLPQPLVLLQISLRDAGITEQDEHVLDVFLIQGPREVEGAGDDKRIVDQDD